MPSARRRGVRAAKAAVTARPGIMTAPHDHTVGRRPVSGTDGVTIAGTILADVQ